MSTYINALPELINPKTERYIPRSPNDYLHRTTQFQQPELAEHTYPRQRRARNTPCIRTG